MFNLLLSFLMTGPQVQSFSQDLATSTAANQSSLLISAASRAALLSHLYATAVHGGYTMGLTTATGATPSHWAKQWGAKQSQRSPTKPMETRNTRISNSPMA